MRRISTALIACFALAAPTAFAQSCGVFTDVPAVSPFCANVTWLRNRAITLGCSATQYCPSDPVTRLQMAAFFNRLANALDPITVRVEQTGGALDLTNAQVICQTPPQAIQTPRKFMLHGVFSARGAPDGDVLVTPMMSVNGGPFGNLNQTNAAMTVRATVWHSTALMASPQPGPSYNLQVGDTYTFGIYVQRNSGLTNLNESRCYYTVELRDRQE